MAINQRKTPRARMLVLILGVAALAALPGCYERVVNARGPGADRYRVEEPYQQDSRLDNWFYGSKPSRTKSPLERKP